MMENIQTDVRSFFESLVFSEAHEHFEHLYQGVQHKLDVIWGSEQYGIIRFTNEQIKEKLK